MGMLPNSIKYVRPDPPCKGFREAKRDAKRSASVVYEEFEKVCLIHTLEWNFNSRLVGNAESVYKNHIHVWNLKSLLVWEVKKQSDFQRSRIKYGAYKCWKWTRVILEATDFLALHDVNTHATAICSCSDMIHTHNRNLWGILAVPHAHRLVWKFQIDTFWESEMLGLIHTSLYGIRSHHYGDWQ